MTRSDIIAAVAELTGFRKKDIETTVAAVFDVIGDALASDGKVMISGFGTFEARIRGEHEGRNPYTGESMTVAPSFRVSFSSGKALKEKLG